MLNDASVAMYTYLSQAFDVSRGQPMAFWQSQSNELDNALGFRTREIENSLAIKPQEISMWEQQPWRGLPEGVLQTPYGEFVEIVDRLKPQAGSKWVDLGAGYGRLGIVLSILAPDVEFVGYEFEPLRAREAQRVYAAAAISAGYVYEKDMKCAEFTPISADVYFLYDFGSRLAVEKVLNDLKEIARNRNIIVVARGRGCRNWIERDHPWLAEVVEPERGHYYTIYRS